VTQTNPPLPVGEAGEPDALTSRLLVAMVRLGRAIRRATESAAPDDSGFYLLRILDGYGPLRMTELATLAGLDHSTVSRKVATLIEDGKLERTPDPSDGRASRLAPTAEGRKAAGVWLAERARILAGAMGTQQEADLERAIAVLEELAANLERDRRQEDRA
jgi:DNA-binding MarR family transcriptional regulator